MKDKIKKDISCQRCKHSWKTTSPYFKVSCPSCGAKVKTYPTLGEYIENSR